MPRFFDQVEALVRKAKSHYVVQSITITNTYMVLKTIFILMILFHSLACGWIYIASSNTGWKGAFLFEHQLDVPKDIYSNAVYYVSTTATTIGYGDIHATTDIEMVYAIFLELVGILIFSLITGNVRNLKLEPNLQNVINKRVKTVEEFIFLIDRMRPHVPLNDNIYIMSTSYID